MAVDDTIRFVPNDVATLALGRAASTGRFLLRVGTPGKRCSPPHTRRLVLELIARHTGQSVEAVERDRRRDCWFTAGQARDHGMVDHVVAHASARAATASWPRRP